MRREGHSEATKELFRYGYDSSLVPSKIGGNVFPIILFTQFDFHNTERIDYNLFCAHMMLPSDYEAGKVKKVGFLKNERWDLRAKKADFDRSPKC